MRTRGTTEHYEIVRDTENRRAAVRRHGDGRWLAVDGPDYVKFNTIFERVWPCANADAEIGAWYDRTAAAVDAYNAAFGTN